MNQNSFIWNGYHNSSWNNIKNFSDPWLHLDVPESIIGTYMNVYEEYVTKFVPFIMNLPETNIFNETTQADFLIPNVFTKLIELNQHLNYTTIAFMKVC